MTYLPAQITNQTKILIHKFFIMLKHISSLKYIFCTVICLKSLLTVNAQVEETSELYKTIKSKDSLLFDVGFNTCVLSQFENLLSEKFEFYHDKDSITSSKSRFISDFKNGLCKST